MDICDFIEKMLNIKLLDYQKKYIKYIDEHPDYQIIIPRGKTTPYYLLNIYIIVKAIFGEYKNEY